MGGASGGQVKIPSGKLVLCGPRDYRNFLETPVAAVLRRSNSQGLSWCRRLVDELARASVFVASSCPVFFDFAVGWAHTNQE